MPEALTVLHLSVRYASRPSGALHSICLDLQHGETLAVLGESGAGKSTLARAMLGMFPADATISGSVLFGGIDLVTAAGKEVNRIRGRRISMLPQDPAWVFHPQRRLGAQIMECLRLHRHAGNAQSASQARASLEAVELDERRFFEAYPHQLSGGQLQRAALALALCCEPEVLIADEPTSALDSVTSAKIWELLARLRAARPLSVMLILHDPRLAVSLAGRAVVLHRGAIVETGEPSSVFARPVHPLTRELADCSTGSGWR